MKYFERHKFEKLTNYKRNLIDNLFPFATKKIA